MCKGAPNSLTSKWGGGGGGGGALEHNAQGST